jgi:2-polyprenyl-3-methyl-5-hydroxy-6-metoxy-1,4-benzoquinol methylase
MSGAESFLKALDRKAKIFARSARETFEGNRETCSWVLDPLARWAERAYGATIFDAAAEAYAEYCVGVAKAKRVYEREGHYTPEVLPKIVSDVYDREDHMVPYMWAAILIYPFWPSMVHHIAMFRDEFVRKLPLNAMVLDVATGHGVLSLLAAEERPDLRIEGIDISSPAITGAKRLLEVSGYAERVRFTVQDALSLNKEGDVKKFHGVISAMLAEHLSDPEMLFASVSQRVAQGGLVYFSTALQSPQRDHVYEFKQESRPLLMAERAGLRVSRLVSDTSAKAAGARFVPRATAMILQPSHMVHSGAA